MPDDMSGAQFPALQIPSLHGFTSSDVQGEPMGFCIAQEPWAQNRPLAQVSESLQAAPSAPLVVQTLLTQVSPVTHCSAKRHAAPSGSCGTQVLVIAQ